MATFNPEVRVAGYAYLGLDVPKHGSGIMTKGLSIIEHPLARGGFEGSNAFPVEVVDLGVHVLATGEVAEEITGDPTALVVSYGRNPYSGDIRLTIERQGNNGQRILREVKDPDHPLRETIIARLKPYLELPKVPFVRRPDFNPNGQVNGRVQSEALTAH